MTRAVRDAECAARGERHEGMKILLIVLLIAAVALGVIGFLIEALLWLAALGLVLFLVTAAYWWLKVRSSRSRRARASQ